MVAAIDALQNAGARVIGLETMPRNYRNLGFYTKLGFVPQNLTVDLTLPVPQNYQSPSSANYEVLYYTAADPLDKAFLGTLADELARRIDPHLAIRHEIELACRFQYGDALCLRDGQQLLACVIAHSRTYSDEETPRYLKVVMMLMDAALSLREILPQLFVMAAKKGLDSIGIRTPTRYARAYLELINAGFQIFHSDLRMTLEGYHEVADPKNFYLCKWE
jgi:hypothetical protein